MLSPLQAAGGICGLRATEMKNALPFTEVDKKGLAFVGEAHRSETFHVQLAFFLDRSANSLMVSKGRLPMSRYPWCECSPAPKIGHLFRSS